MVFLMRPVMAIISGIWGLLIKYTLDGKAGMKFLRLRAEESGNIRKQRKVRVFFAAIFCYNFLLIVFFLLFGFITSIEKPQNTTNNIILYSIIVLSILAETVIRLCIRHAERVAENVHFDLSNPPPPIAESFCVSRSENPDRIKNMSLVLIFCVLIFVPSVKGSVTFGLDEPGFIVAAVAFLVGIVCSLIVIIKETKTVCQIMIINRLGILDNNPKSNFGFIPWDEINDCYILGDDLKIILIHETAITSAVYGQILIPLDVISGDTIIKKVVQYRAFAEHEPISEQSHPNVSND